MLSEVLDSTKVGMSDPGSQIGVALPAESGLIRQTSVSPAPVGGGGCISVWSDRAAASFGVASDSGVSRGITIVDLAEGPTKSS